MPSCRSPRWSRFVPGIALLLLLGGSPSLGADPPADLAALEKDLGSPVVTKRLEALGRLEGMPGVARAEQAVLRALDDGDWSVEIRAAAVLGKIGSEAALEPLASLALRGEIHRVREAAVRALEALPHGELGERVLRRARTTKEVVDKARAVEVAGRLATPELVGKFREYVHHKEVDVAAAAARAVGFAGRHPQARAQALALLDDVLADRDERRRFLAYAAAVEAVGRLQAPEALTLLVREVVLQEDDDGYLPERVARALRAADPAAAAQALRAGVALAKKPAPLRRLVRLFADVGATALAPEVEALLAHRDEAVRAEAVRTLGRFAAPSSTPILASRLADGSAEVRREAVRALARTAAPEEFRKLAGPLGSDKDVEVRVQVVVEVADQGAPEGIPALEPFLADPEWRVATAALAAIGTLGVATDLPRIAPLVESASWKVRGAAYEAMGRLRAAAAIPLLAEGLLDKDPLVRGVCLANLQILTKERLGTKPDRWRDWWARNGKDLVLVKRSRRSKEEIEAERRREEEELAKARYAHEKDDVTRAREARKRNVEILQKARILVVTGAWDHVEKVLDHLTIPHTLLRAQELKEVGINPNQVILVNCEGTIDRDAAERLRWFVNVGGYLMTTDWALTHTVEPCFPGFVEQFSGSSTGNDVVVVEEARPGHPWTRGIFEEVPALMWWLEVQAFPIRVETARRCDVIVDSAAMRQRYGSSPMAVAFRWGLGKVQHSISHFYLQEEGMQQTTDPRRRMVFAADHLGLSLEQIRLLAEQGRWSGQLNEETMKEIAPDYSMFRLIVNVVKEKSDWVEAL